jgi:streptogramin lyase
MSSRLDPSWRVLASYQTPEGDRCVDVFARPEGTFGFEEFRRDPEDLGAWTPIAYHSRREFPTEVIATDAARAAIQWLGPLLGV